MVFSFQHIGNRKTQEDSYFIDEEKGLFVVCDGVGGFENGEFASQLIINSIVSFFEKLQNRNVDTEVIVKAIKLAQADLNAAMELHAFNSSIGSTIALLYCQNGKAITAHMGDSRILHLKKASSTFWTTKDHSLVQELYDAKVLKSKAEMERHPMKNKITNAIFSGQEPSEIFVTTHELDNIESEDTFALFTDGVLEAYSDQRLCEMFQHEKFEQTFQEISEHVKANSCDNSTLIVLKVSD